jgi:hypothetical protein
MKSLLLFALLLGITTYVGCSKSKTGEKNDPYASHFGQYNYFETPKKVTARSGAEFEIVGWLTHELKSNEKKFMALRLLCRWPANTPNEKQVYTPANVLVDGYNVGGDKARLQHANLASTEEDEKAGFQIFILVQIYMPMEWEKVEIQFQGLTPTLLKLNNI